MSDTIDFSSLDDAKLDEAMENFVIGQTDNDVKDKDADEVTSKAADDEKESTENLDDKNEEQDEDNSDDEKESTEESEDKSSSDKESNDDEDEIDYKEQYEALLAPIKASGKVREIKDIEEARALMSFGIDYHKNMNKISPFVKFGKTLEKHGLLQDVDKLNLLIDAAKGNKDAILALAKEHNVEIDTYGEDGEASYTPSDNIIPDEELRLSNVIDEIKDTETFNRTVDVVSKDWDKESKNKVISNPHILKVLNSQMADGTFDKVQSEIERLSILNQIPVGMSDIDIYGAVAKHLQEQQTKQDETVKKESTQQRVQKSKRVAQAKKTSGRTSSGFNEKPFSQMSDKELEKVLGFM